MAITNREREVHLLSCRRTDTHLAAIIDEMDFITDAELRGIAADLFRRTYWDTALAAVKPGHLQSLSKISVVFRRLGVQHLTTSFIVRLARFAGRHRLPSLISQLYSRKARTCLRSSAGCLQRKSPVVGTRPMAATLYPNLLAY